MASFSPTGLAPVLQVHPTRRCNLACGHCYTSSGPMAGEALTPERLAACLDDAAGLGYRQLAVSGGEPLLYRPLIGLLRMARDRGMTTTITTNGLLISDRLWARLAPLVDLVAVSIDGRPAEHDALRGQGGAFTRTVARLATIRASGVPFGLIFTLTQVNVDSLEFVVRLAADQGARSVQVHPLTLHGRAANQLPAWRPDDIELAAALAEATRLGAGLGVAVHVDALQGRQIRRYRDHLVPPRPVTTLTAAAPILIVGADGMVLPLTHELDPSLALGSLHQAGLGRLARDWLADGRADALADACERTWQVLAAPMPERAVYWYGEVAARAKPPAPRGPWMPSVREGGGRRVGPASRVLITTVMGGRSFD